MPTESFLDATEEELLRIANGCLNQAGAAVSGPSSVKADLTKLRLFLEAQLCLSEVIRKRADQAALRDRDRENRHFWIEIGLTILIVILIGVELYFSIHYGRLGLSEGRQQAAILQQMNKNTEDTAVQIQRAADAMTVILQVLQADRADRAKKPRPALYIGNIRIDKATVRPTLPATVPNGPGQSMARLDLLLKNEGDAPLSASEIHALVPEGINVALSPVPPVPEYEEPSKPGTRTMSYAVPLTPIGKTLRIDCQILVPKGHAPFKITFTMTAPQLQAVTPLGSLTVLPPKP